MDLSIIVSVYNQRSSALGLIAALAEQTTTARFEVIVCDDGSGDGLLDGLRTSASARALDLRYVWQPDRGFRLSRSRNNAIRCAQGKILVLLDGDQWVPPRFLDAHLAAHQCRNVLVCGMRFAVTAPDAASLPVPDRAFFKRLQRQPQLEHSTQRRWMASNRPWMAFLAANGSLPASAAVTFDERFESWGSEDRDFACRCADGGLAPVLLENPEGMAIHLAVAGDRSTPTPHERVVALLRNKSYLAQKYPLGEMEPSLEMVKRCHLDPVTQRWSMGTSRRDASIADVLLEFAQWERLEQTVNRPGKPLSLASR